MDEKGQARLEREYEIAAARLDVAENFTWALSLVSAAGAHLAGWGVWGAIAAFAGVLWLAPLTYRKAEAAAEDAWHRAAGLGRYVR
jgi:hypothetical protein